MDGRQLGLGAGRPFEPAREYARRRAGKNGRKPTVNLLGKAAPDAQ